MSTVLIRTEMSFSRLHSATRSGGMAVNVTNITAQHSTAQHSTAQHSTAQQNPVPMILTVRVNANTMAMAMGGPAAVRKLTTRIHHMMRQAFVCVALHILLCSSPACASRVGTGTGTGAAARTGAGAPSQRGAHGADASINETHQQDTLNIASRWSQPQSESESEHTQDSMPAPKSQDKGAVTWPFPLTAIPPPPS